MLEIKMDQKNKTRNASLMMLVATICVAASFPVSKSLMQYISAELALCIRFVISSALFYIFIQLKGLSVSIIPQRWKAYLFVSSFYAMFFISTFEALKLTSAFNTSVIYTLMPSVSLLIAWFTFKDTKLKHYIVPLILSTLASMVVVTQGKLSFFDILKIVNMGDLIFLLGTICMACFFNVTKKYTSGEPPLVSTFYILLGNTVWMFLYLLLSPEKLIFNPNTIVVVELIFLVLFCTVFTFFSVQYATKWIAPIKISSFSYLTPICVVLINFGFFSMEVNSIVVFSSVISILSLFYIQWTSGEKAAQ
ncbi:DMT family transporter [Moritella yayanosii]|uniref:Putative Membrane protein n=1 Tax=Moritella yayanosii TaxID=69539 RepID=A0A330LUV0_9GAMM|nr:DMT family transporter [Moritella yayanosii]SQD79791.1 putative Membrane protein [Moritella yayanosii]